MKKRQKKKLARYTCLKCRKNDDGIDRHYQLKSGRWVSEYCLCFPCDVPGYKEQIEEIKKKYPELDV